MPYDPRYHRRRSIRLPGYDYTQPGMYFVTICAAERGALFGQVSGDHVTLSPAGQIVDVAWRKLPRYFLHTTLDTWIIMPDHLHGIVVIERLLVSSPTPDQSGPRGTVPRSLPAIVQNFKAVTTKRINRLRCTPGRRVWQEDYYEHIVRDESDLARIRRYIAANPIRWRG